MPHAFVAVTVQVVKVTFGVNETVAPEVVFSVEWVEESVQAQVVVFVSIIDAVRLPVLRSQIVVTPEIIGLGFTVTVTVPLTAHPNIPKPKKDVAVSVQVVVDDKVAVVRVQLLQDNDVDGDQE